MRDLISDLLDAAHMTCSPKTEPSASVSSPG